MPVVLKLDISSSVIISLLLFSSMVSCALLVYIVTKSRSGRVMAFFISGQILILIWTVFYVFEYLAPTVEIRWVIVCIEYFTLCFVGFAFMHFSYIYTRHKMMKLKWFYITLISPTFTYLGVLTNPLHHQFYYEFTLESEVFGPLTYVIIITTISYLLIGAGYFLNKVHLKSIIRQRQSMYFIIAIMLPVLTHLLHTIGIFDFGFPLTLVIIPFSILLFTVSVLKYQFLDVLPIAVNETIDSMSDGMIVVNNKGEITDYNDTLLKKFFNISLYDSNMKFEEVRYKIAKYASDEHEVNALMNSLNIREGEPLVKGTIHAKNIYQNDIIVYYAAIPILDYSKAKSATLITFFDMSDVYELSKQLEDKNLELTDANERLMIHTKNVQQLTMETEHNRIMADIHDTLGHSMIELLALLEVVDLMMEQDEEKVLLSIDEALEKGRDSLKEIRSAVSRYKKMGGMS